MSRDAYTLKQKKETEELHLFKGRFTEQGRHIKGNLNLRENEEVRERRQQVHMPG